MNIMNFFKNSGVTLPQALVAGVVVTDIAPHLNEGSVATNKVWKIAVIIFVHKGCHYLLKHNRWGSYLDLVEPIMIGTHCLSRVWYRDYGKETPISKRVTKISNPNPITSIIAGAVLCVLSRRVFKTSTHVYFDHTVGILTGLTLGMFSNFALET